MTPNAFPLALWGSFSILGKVHGFSRYPPLLFASIAEPTPILLKFVVLVYRRSDVRAGVIWKSTH